MNDKNQLINVAIIGGRDGFHVIEEIKAKASGQYNVVCLADNNDKLWGTTQNGVSIISVDEAIEKHNAGVIDLFIIAVRKGYSRFCIIQQLHGKGVKNILLVKPAVLTYNLPIVFEKDNPIYKLHWLDLREQNRPLIHHLEANLADGCNLNCKGCLHFSNLYDRDDIPDWKELIQTITEISKRVDIFQFRVLGGEPLLNNDLEGFLVQLRRVLPETDLAVISNGILIPNMPRNLYKTMHKLHLGFNLTLYPPTLKKKEQIYGVLNEECVAYGSHEVKIDRFEKFIKLSPGSERAYEKCEPRGILVVKGRRLYRCPIEAYINKLYEKYDIRLKAPEGIDIYDDTLDWEKVVNDLYESPRPLCTYCAEESVFYDWSSGKPQLEDWVVE